LEERWAGNGLTGDSFDPTAATDGNSQYHIQHY